MQTTFTQTTITECNRLVIKYDYNADSPRESDDVTKLSVSPHRRYDFPNEHNLSFQDDDEIKAELTTLSSTHYIFPLDFYEHSGIAFSLSGKGMQCQFDTSRGIWYVTVPKSYTYNYSSTEKKTITYTEQQAKEMAESTIKEYNAFINGEVYRYTLHDEQGEEVDSCGWFYSFAEIKDNLPTEWKDEDMDEYFID